MAGLGDHAFEVLLGALVGLTLVRARRVMRRVREAEARDG